MEAAGLTALPEDRVHSLWICLISEVWDLLGVYSTTATLAPCEATSETLSLMNRAALGCRGHPREWLPLIAPDSVSVCRSFGRARLPDTHSNVHSLWLLFLHEDLLMWKDTKKVLSTSYNHSVHQLATFSSTTTSTNSSDPTHSPYGGLDVWSEVLTDQSVFGQRWGRFGSRDIVKILSIDIDFHGMDAWQKWNRVRASFFAPIQG